MAKKQIRIHRTTATRDIIKLYNRELRKAKQADDPQLSDLGFNLTLVLFGSAYRRRQFCFGHMGRLIYCGGAR
jgi:hypothetical protein